MQKTSKIYIAGHRRMVGSSLRNNLQAKGFTNLLLRTSSEFDLTNTTSVEDFFEKEKPNYVFLAAAKVGGIMTNNTYRADFLYENLMIQNNVIHQAYLSGVTKLLFLGSSCIYPKLAPQPLREEYFLTGTLEPTNEPYAIAKIAGIKMCDAYRSQYGCDFISAMSTNLYEPNDNYDLNNSHVLPAMLRKFHKAKNDGNRDVEIWGSGAPRREFLHTNDLAEACVFLMENFSDITGHTGNIIWDSSKPDGTPRKLMDVTKINEMGWKAEIGLEDGIREVYQQKFSD